MSALIISIKSFVKKLSLSFTKESGLAGIFFFLVLCSWYILRPVRNEMAVQNSDILPYLLGIGALVMLLLNPIYSWLASQRNLRGVLIGCYSFFIINLLIFITLWEFLIFPQQYGSAKFFIFGAMSTLFLYFQFFGW